MKSLCGFVIALFLSLLAFPAAAFGSPTGAEVILGSAHYCPESARAECSVLNETNPGAGLRWDANDRGWVGMVGAYHNSMSRLTVYAGGERELWRWRDVSLSAFAGIASGYSPLVTPAFMPRLHAGPVVMSVMPFLVIDSEGEVTGDVGVAFGFSLVHDWGA